MPGSNTDESPPAQNGITAKTQPIIRRSKLPGTMAMSLEQTINTEPLLTIMGIVAAAWAIIPKTRLLQISMNLSWIDWTFTGLALLLANYLTFEPLLTSYNLYYSVGPWLPGLDSASATYIIFVISFIWLWRRSVSAHIPRGNLSKFKSLLDTLIAKKQYDDIATLIEPEIETIAKYKDTNSTPSKLAYCIIKKEWKITPKPFVGFLNKVTEKDTSREIARNIILSITESQETVDYLSITNPSICMQMIDIDVVIKSDFSDRFIGTLISNTSSRVYMELKPINAPTTADNNHIIKKLFKDPDIAVKHYAIDKAAGNFAISSLKNDFNLIAKINKISNTYSEKDKYHCPIYTTISLLDIMVKEEILKGYQDHRSAYWMDGIFKSIINAIQDGEQHDYTDYEQIPAYILTNEIISISMNWIKLGIHVDERRVIDYNQELGSRHPTAPKIDYLNPDPIFIPRKIPEIIKTIIDATFKSKLLSEKIKFSHFESIMILTKELKHPFIPTHDNETEAQRRSDLFNTLVKCMVFGTKYSPTSEEYKEQFRLMFNSEMLDHILKEKLKDVGDALSSAKQNEGRQAH